MSFVDWFKASKAPATPAVEQPTAQIVAQNQMVLGQLEDLVKSLGASDTMEQREQQIMARLREEGKGT